MARARTPATELARRLNASKRPLYVVDAQYTIVFLNSAAQAWLGAGAEGLPGTRCVYATAPIEGPQAVAAALCPPPEAMAGVTMEASVAIAAPGDNEPPAWRVRFTPLGTTPEDMLGVVAMVLPQSAGTGPAGAAKSLENEPDPRGLHEMVRRFRHEAASRYGADRLIGDSPAMRLARRQVELAAGCRASVLILGPRGSGRRHTAGAIHYRANRDEPGPLVPVECASLPAELVYSTLQALAASQEGPDTRRGTVLLCDADRIPVEMHGALARVLGKPSFAMRIIATAERSPGELAKRGKYEPELAALLSTICVELPPLSERRRDLPALAQLLVEECNVRADRQLGGLTPEAMDLLVSCPWPTNLDGLAAAIEESHPRAPGPLITAEDIPASVRHARQAAGTPARPKEETIVLDEFLARIERELIRRAIDQAKGNKAKAARLLGLTRPRFYRRMVQLELEP